MNKRCTAWRPALLTLIFTLALPAMQVRAEDCTGLLPDADCTLDEDTTAALTISQGIVLTIDAIPNGGTILIGHDIDGKNGIQQGSIATAGNGSIIYQSADIGSFPDRALPRITINNGDIWYLSHDSSITLYPLASVYIDGGILGVDPGSALSFISAGIRGGAGTDILDFQSSNGQWIGTTGTIGHAGVNIDLGDGDDRFVYYQSVGSMIEVDRILLRNGNNLMGLTGSSVGSVFEGDFFTGTDNDTLVFYSGSTATFGSATSIFSFGFGDDVIDFDSGIGLAGGTIMANRLDMSTGADTITMTENAQILISSGGSLIMGDDNDAILFTSGDSSVNGGFIDITAADFDMGDGDDLLQFNNIAYNGTQGLEATGSTFTMGAGNDTILFVSGNVGLNAPGTYIGLGDGDDEIIFQSAMGPIVFTSGSGLFSVNGGTGDDRIEFASAAVTAYGNGPQVSYGNNNGDAAIVNVETIDIGNGSLSFFGTIDSTANIINFISAEFYGGNTNILAYLSGGNNANAQDVLFSSGATFSGTADLDDGDDSFAFTSGAVLAATGIVYMSAGNDSVFFDSATVTAGSNVSLGTGDDTAAIGASIIDGTIDGGSDVNDALIFTSGMTTLSGDILGFTSGQLQAGATLNIIDSGSVAVDLFGTGTSTIQFGETGSTANNFTLNNTIDGVDLQILGDTLETNGQDLGLSTALTNITIADGGTLNVDLGSDIISSGILDVDGTLRMSSATLHADSYNENAANAGAFIFEIANDGTTTHIGDLSFTSGGIDFANSGDTFNFVRAIGSGTVTADTITFLSGAASAPNAANITGDTILYNFFVNLVGTELQLDIQQTNTIESLTSSPNNNTLANILLVDMINSTDPDINALQNALLYSTNSNAFNDYLEEASPIMHGGELQSIQTVNQKTFGLINQRLALLRKDRQGDTGISTGNITEELKAWWQFYAASGVQQTRNNISGFNTTTYGMAVGVDQELIEDGFFGLSFSWGGTVIQGKGAGQPESEVDSYQVSAYGDYDFGRLYLNGMVSASYNDISTARSSAAGNRSANYHANYYTARGEVGYSFMPGKTRIIPYLMGQYGYYTPSAYRETGAASQIIETDSLKSLEFGGGLNLSWLKYNDNGSYFIPEMRLGYRYDFENEPYILESRFAAGGPVFTMQGPAPAQQALDLGLGMTYFSKENWELLFNYDFEYKGDYTSHAGTVRASYKFYP